MKKFILTIALIMLTVCQFSEAVEFKKVGYKITICPDQNTIAQYNDFVVQTDLASKQQAYSYVTSGMCSQVSDSAKFEILSANSVVAEVVFYDKEGKLMQDHPMWVRLDNINMRGTTTEAQSVASQIGGN